MRVVVAGAGNVGVFLAEDLSAAGHEVLVIEQDRELGKRLSAQLSGVTTVVGDACEVRVLDAAGAGGAEVVVAATGDDEDNLVISLLAKQEFAVPRVVARVNHPKNRWMFTQSWGVDVSVSTPHLLSALVEEAVSVGALVRLLQLDASGARLVEATLGPSSPGVGKCVAQLGMPRNASVVAIVRRGHVVVPRGDSRLDAGDEVLVLVAPDSEDRVRSLLVGGRPTEASVPPSAPAGEP